VAARYSPEYYIIVKEPLWYLGGIWTGAGGMLNEGVTVDQWVELTEELADAVREASLGTSIGIAIALPFQESIDYLIKADALEEIDFVGVDIYNLRSLDAIEEHTEELSKPRWILETWDGIPDSQIGQMWRTRSASEWIRMMANYAQSRGYVGLATFYNLWLCYDYGPKPWSIEEVGNRLDKRQETFHTLQELVQRVGVSSREP
jgi:hypothetical protein